MGIWVFEFAGGVSSLTEYITEDESFVAVADDDDDEEEEDTIRVVAETPESFSGEKLAGSGGEFASKGRRT